MATVPETTDIERAAALCAAQAAKYRVRADQFAARGMTGAALDVLHAKAETAENLAAAIRKLANAPDPTVPKTTVGGGA